MDRRDLERLIAYHRIRRIQLHRAERHQEAADVTAALDQLLDQYLQLLIAEDGAH